MNSYIIGDVFNINQGNVGIGSTTPTSKLDIIGTITSTNVISDLTGNVSGSISGGSVAGEGSGLTTINATNISSGTLDNARLPSAISVTSLTGDGSGLTSLNATNISSGTLNNARLPSTITVTTVNADVTGDLTGNVSGSISGGSVAGEGSGLTSLNATNISSGTLDNARLPSAISVTSLTGDGSGLTALNATNISSGTLNNARLPSTITVTTVNADLTGDLTGNVSGSISGGSVAGEGSGLTALNATNISSGTLDNARLPSAISVTSLTGDGSGLTALNATNISSGTLNNARLPSIINTTTLIGTQVGIGTNTPQENLHVEGNIYSTGNIVASNLSIIGDFTTLNTVTSNTEQIVVYNQGTGPALKVYQTGIQPIAEFYDGDYSEASQVVVKIANDGKLGIGTEPREKLDIIGTAIVSTKVGIGSTQPISELDITGSLIASGNVSGAYINGNGTGLTALNATNISSGTLDNARLPSAISVTSLTGDGSGLTALNADNISSGTLNNARLPSTITVTTVNADVTGDLTGNVSGSISGGSVAGEGSGLTALNATNISSGTLDNARLPSTITVTTVNADVTGDLTGNVSGSISGGSVAGEGSGLTALNATNISSGTLDNARLPSAISVTSLTGDGSGLTALNATNISSGTLNNARLPSTITVTTVNADVTGDLTGNVSGSISGGSVAGEGSGLTALNATNISSGTLDNARLPSAISVTSLTGDGSGLTALNADNISSGTLNNARLPSTITVTTVNADVTGDVTGNVSGSISGGSVAGEGSGLTALNATNISSGTLDNARLPSAISVTSLTGDGSGLTALNATNISSGTLNNARLPSTITVTTVNADVTGDLTGNVSGSISGGSVSGEGSGLTALNATNISSGTLNNARLPSTITVTTVNADVTGDLTGNVSGSISGGSVSGEGSGLTALNATNISSGTLNNARLPSAISVTSLTGDGSGLTSLNATNISSGTLNNARLPSIITVTTVNADVTGDLTGNVSGSISGGSVAGEGSGLTALNATNISSGTLDNARLPSAISVTSLTGDGSGLTALNATNISSGTLNNARLPSTITVTTVNADVTGDVTGNVSGSISGGSVAGEGSGLTALNATNISSGTLDNARLPSAISVTSLTGDGSGLTALNADNISSGTIDSARLPTITATVDTSEINSSNIVILGDILTIYSQYNSNIAHITENAFKLPSGSSNLRPDVPTEGEIRFNTDINRFEGYYSSNLGWNTITNESVYSFSATYLSSNQYIAVANSNVGEIAQFNAQYSVPGSTFDTSTYKYVVPQNGVYSFDVSLPNSPLIDIERERIVNDVTTYTTLKSLDYSYTPISSLHISAVQLQTNDKVYVRVYTDVDGATQYNSRFEGNLVSGGLSTSTMSTTVTDEVRSFQYSCSSNTEIVMSQPLDQILPLQVKVYDTDNLWDVGTNSFTVPSGYAGFWDITVNGIVNTFNIYKTPSGGSSQLFGTIMNNGTKQLLLNVGDKIEIYFTSTISASYSHYYFITATQIAKPHTISSLVNVTKGFKYKLASDQNITSGTSTKINFTDPVFEVGDVFDSTNNWLLSGVTTSGLWSFDFRVGGQDGELLVVDEKAENTNGGDFGANPVVRDLNTVRKNTIAGASLATNTITLPPGTYEADAFSSVVATDRSQISLRDTSNNILVQGMSVFANPTGYFGNTTKLKGVFTINTTTNIQLILNRNTNLGDGYEGGVGDFSAYGPEIFSLVHLKRVPGILTLNHYDYSTASSNVYSYNGDNGSSTLYVEEGDKVWLESTESVSSSNSYFEGVLTTSVNLTVDESTVYTRGFHYTRTTNQAITEGVSTTIEYSTKVQNTTGLAETILNGVFTTPNSGLWRFDFAAGGQDGELLVVDEKAEGTNGGDFGPNPVVRDLNTVRKNTIAGASLATNTITLPPGTYEAEAYSTTINTNRSQISIRDTSNNILLQGMSDWTDPSGGNAICFAKGFFTINTTTNIQLIFNRATDLASGYEGGVGDLSAYGPEIFSLVHLKRVPGNLTLYKTPVATLSPLTYDSPILMGTYDASGGHQVVTCAKYDKVEVKYNGYLIANSSDRKVFFSGQQTAATTTTEAVGLIADDVTGVIETAGNLTVGNALTVTGKVGIGTNNPDSKVDITGSVITGITWNANTFTTRVTNDNNWRNVVWAPELKLFVATAYSGTDNSVMTSPDGITWTTRSTPIDNNWYGITWAPELRLLVAVARTGQSGNRVMTSPDGINWTTRSTPVDNEWITITWAPELGLFVAVAYSGTGDRVMTSPNGINWTTRSTPVDNNWIGLTWSPELELLVATSTSGTGNRVMTSPDGINWTTRSSAADNNWYSIIWAPELGLFVAVASSGTGNRVMTSSDGINWTTRSSAADNNWFGITWAPELGLFITSSWSGTGNRVMTSPDGINWTTRSTPNDNNWYAITWAPELGLLVAVAYSGTGDRVMTASANTATSSILKAKEMKNSVEISNITVPYDTNYNRKLTIRGDTTITGNGIFPGKVGIGTTNPLSKLSITPYDVEPKITLWDGGSTTDHYGFGISVFQLNYHVGGTGRHVFYYGGKNGDGTELMRIQGDGRVGIGTNAPVSASLLHVEGSGIDYTWPASGYYFTIGSSIATGPVGGRSLNNSIYAAGAITSRRGFYATSDERIKTNGIEIIDTEALDILRKLKPRKYEYIDKISKNTDTPVFGFYAQEVEELIPYAVGTSSEYIPNIYSQGTIENIDGEKYISINSIEGLSEKLNNYEGSNIKIYYRTYPEGLDIDNIKLEDYNSCNIKIKEYDISVKEIINDTTFSINENFDINGKIFIYGHYVSDFKSLKYNSIYTIATSAIQEIDRQLQTTKEELQTTKEELQTLKSFLQNKYPGEL